MEGHETRSPSIPRHLKVDTHHYTSLPRATGHASRTGGMLADLGHEKDTQRHTNMHTDTDIGTGLQEGMTDNAPLPWNDPEYVRFVQALDGQSNKVSTDGMSRVGMGQGDRNTSPSEVYQSLLKRERRALDTVDRVVNDARKTELASLELVDLPMRDLARRALTTGKSIMDDLVEANSAADIGHALVSGDRKVFLGGALIMIAIASALVSSFSPGR